MQIAPLVRAAMAAALLVSALFAILSGIVSFRQARTTVNPMKPETATTLVTSGVFRYTRNPMYLGMLLVLLAWAAFLASPASLAGVIAFVIYMRHFQIRPEEAALTSLFGQAYLEYRQRVRRWL